MPIVMTSALGSGSLKKSPDAVPTRLLQPGGGDVFLRDGFDRRQIEAGAFEVRVFLRDFNAQQAGRAADVAERLEFREIKFVRERLEVDPREAGHRAHELFQPGQIRVEFFEHALLAVLDLVLRLGPSATPRGDRSRT